VSLVCPVIVLEVMRYRIVVTDEGLAEYGSVRLNPRRITWDQVSLIVRRERSQNRGASLYFIDAASGTRITVDDGLEGFGLFVAACLRKLPLNAYEKAFRDGGLLSSANPNATRPRRKLSFTILDEVLVDAENLSAKGYERVGNWNLAQVVGHLAAWIRFPVEGYPKMPRLVSPLVALMRGAAGTQPKDRRIAEGFADGNETNRATIPAALADPGESLRKLREAIESFKAYTGPIHPSPRLGSMSKDEAMRMQLRHCEHHLGFLVPKS